MEPSSAVTVMEGQITPEKYGSAPFAESSGEVGSEWLVMIRSFRYGPAAGMSQSAPRSGGTASMP